MTEIPQKFMGSFKLEKSENFDEFLAKKGVPWVVRKMIGMQTMTKVFKLNEDGVSYTLDNQTAIKHMTWTFKLGEPFESKAFDGKMHKITMSVDGDTVLENHVRTDDKNDQGETYTYIIDGDYLIFTMEIEGLTAKRHFKKVA